jgi:hypothetical protein
MIIKYSLRTVNQAVYSRAITALLAAMLAVFIDPISRFSELPSPTAFARPQPPASVLHPRFQSGGDGLTG